MVVTNGYNKHSNGTSVIGPSVAIRPWNNVSAGPPPHRARPYVSDGVCEISVDEFFFLSRHDMLFPQYNHV